MCSYRLSKHSLCLTVFHSKLILRSPPYQSISLLLDCTEFFALLSSILPPTTDEERSHWTKPNWTSLPLHILSKIGETLEAFDDHLRFRSVCKTFQMAIPSPIKTIIPIKVQNISFPFYTDHGVSCGRIDHFLLTESTIFALEPLLNPVSSSNETSQTWFVNIERKKAGAAGWRTLTADSVIVNCPTTCPELLTC